jgi:hypothetical protein
VGVGVNDGLGVDVLVAVAVDGKVAVAAGASVITSTIAAAPLVCGEAHAVTSTLSVLNANPTPSQIRRRAGAMTIDQQDTVAA